MNRANGGGLFSIKPQALSGHREACSPVGDSGRFAGEFGKAFTPQRLQRGIVKFQFGNLMAPDFSLTQRRQRLLLFARALKAVDINRLPLFGGKPVPHWRRAGGFPLAQHDR